MPSFFAKPTNPILRPADPAAIRPAFHFPQAERGGNPRSLIGGYTATRTGAVAWSTGPYGPTLSYPANAGSNDYTQVPFDSRLDLTNRNWTFAWVMTPTGAGASGYAIIANQGGPLSDLRFYFLLDPGRKLMRYSQFQSNFVVTFGQTYRVVYTFVAGATNTGIETFYVDGVQVATSGPNVAVAASNAAITFGATPGGHSFRGQIDAMTLWPGVALSASQAAAWCADPFALGRSRRNRAYLAALPAGGPGVAPIASYFQRRRAG